MRTLTRIASITATAAAAAAMASAVGAGTASASTCLTTGLAQEAVATLAPTNGLAWQLDQVQPGADTTCPTLAWATAKPVANFADSPTAVLLFKDGAYQGLATEPTSFTTVTGATDTSVTVSYRWLVGGDSAAAPAGGPTSVTFTGAGQVEGSAVDA